jgi:hypothetical protein
VSFIILRIERIALGGIGRVAVLAIKRPQVWARVQLRGTLHVDNGLEFVEVDVGEEGKHAGSNQHDKDILEQTVQEPECVSTPDRSKLGTQPIRERTSEDLLEI